MNSPHVPVCVCSHAPAFHTRATVTRLPPDAPNNLQARGQLKSRRRDISFATITSSDGVYNTENFRDNELVEDLEPLAVIVDTVDIASGSTRCKMLQGLVDDAETEMLGE